MKIAGKFSFIFYLLLSLKVLSQSFPEFDKLRQQGDSAHQKKNYLFGIQCYQKALSLPESKKPKLFGAVYYDLAGLYSCNHDKENALAYLALGFKTYLKKTGRNDLVSASHILSDNDLDFIKEDRRFKDFLRSNYSPRELEFGKSKEISYSVLLNYISSIKVLRQNEPILIEDKIIYWQKKDTSLIYNPASKSLDLPNSELLEKHPLRFVNCSFKMNLVWANFYLEKQKTPYELVSFTNCTFEGNFVMSEMNFRNPPVIQKCDVWHDLYLHAFVSGDGWGGFKLTDTKLHDAIITFACKTPISLFIENNVAKDSGEFFLAGDDIKKCIVKENRLAATDFSTRGKFEILQIENNEFNDLILSKTLIESEFDLIKTPLSGRMLLRESYFSNEPVNDIDWKYLNDLRLGFLKSDYHGKDPYITGGDNIFRLSKAGVSYSDFSYDSLREFVAGGKDADISDEDSFQRLMGLYSMFLNLYKNKNNIESYNACFVQIKELQSRRLKYLYESDRSFKTYFRWKLSRLLKFYVNHGTDPAQAIVISINIIIAFGIFFFFFPSDWDTTSKAKLIQNFKDFIQKNEKGYIIPFFVLLWGFIISLLNAVTLSLNAFITLGFGNIPTHGIARYFCVIEGFLGWFLLSIFTVAMINQVL